MGQVLKLMTDKNVSRKLPTDYERIPFLPTPAPDVLADVGELFLHLTSWTVPHGWELLYYGKMLEELGFQMDAHHNWWIQIGAMPPPALWLTSIPRAERQCQSHGRSRMTSARPTAGVSLALMIVREWHCFSTS
jgi:hypothetical protein